MIICYIDYRGTGAGCLARYPFGRTTFDNSLKTVEWISFSVSKSIFVVYYIHITDWLFHRKPIIYVIIVWVFQRDESVYVLYERIEYIVAINIKITLGVYKFTRITLTNFRDEILAGVTRGFHWYYDDMGQWYRIFRLAKSS